MRSLPAVFVCLSLAACGGSGSLGSIGLGSIGSAGPARVSGTSDRAQLPDLIPAKRRIQQVDQRVAIAQVTSAEITPTLAGPLLRASGTARISGSFNAELLPIRREGSVLVLKFVAMGQSEAGLAPRSVTAARLLTASDLAGIRSVRIEAAQNSKTLRAR